MAAGVGSKVEYLDYNQIQSIVSNVFGTGQGDAGYGQIVTSSQVTQNALVTVSQWNSLRNDLLKARQHQSGVDESGNLGLPTLDIRLSEADRAAYLSMANLISNNRTVSPPSSEASFVTLITSNRASGWNGTVNQTITIEFGTANNLRWFFNAGGNFQVSSSLTNFATTGDSKLVNESWDVLLRNMGIIKLSNSSTTNSGTGTPATNIGFVNLTSTNQLIFSKLVENGNQYTPNQYDLYAKISGGTALVLTPTWSYTDAGNDGGYRIFEPVIGTLNSICQMYIATGANVAVAYPQVQFSGTSWTYSSSYGTPPPSYSITPNITSINEGSTVTYTVSTANVANGTVLYWKNLGSSTASDFTDTANSGTVTITSDVGTITRQVRADTVTEGPETIILQLLTGSLTGTSVSVADIVTINDTSLTPISYSISPNVPSQDEGLPVTFTITTVGVPDGTILYWINVGTTNFSDFPNSVNDGSVSIIGGTATITRSAQADFATEGPETIIIELRSGSVNGPLLATSSTVTIVDTSLAPLLPSYDVAPNIYSVNEGTSLPFYVNTSNVSNGTVLYWTINTAVSDFSTSNGTVTINSNTGSFTVTPTLDFTTEGPESFSVSLRTGSIIGQVVSVSPTITIGDTSTTPPPPPPTYTLYLPYNSVNEGSNINIVVQTTNVETGKVLYWNINNGSTVDADFSTTTGTVTIGNDGTGQISIATIADNSTEGSQTFTVSISLDNGGNPLTTSGSITINDTSLTPPPPPPPPSPVSLTFNATGFSQYVKRGSSVNVSFTASGGRAPYVYGINGTTPGTTSSTGASCGYQGTVNSIPNTNGDFTFTITATDADGVQGSVEKTVRIYGIVSQTALIGSNTNSYTYTSPTNAFALSVEGGDNREIVVTSHLGFPASGADNNPIATMSMTVGGVAYEMQQVIAWSSFLNTRVNTGIFRATIPASAGTAGTLSASYTANTIPGHKWYRAYTIVTPTTSGSPVSTDVGDSSSGQQYALPVVLNNTTGIPSIIILAAQSFRTGNSGVFTVGTTGLENVNAVQQTVDSSDWRVYNLSAIEPNGSGTSQTITVATISGTTSCYSAAAFK